MSPSEVARWNSRCAVVPVQRVLTATLAPDLGLPDVVRVNGVDYFPRVPIEPHTADVADMVDAIRRTGEA